jgi:hypothetical protein
MPELARVVTTDAEIDAAIRHARMFEKYDQRVVRATYSDRTDRILLRMENGVTHVIPRMLLQGLQEAAPGALNKIELLGRGTGLYWPALDVAHQVPGLLAGVYGSAKWMKKLLDSTSTRLVTRARDRARKPLLADSFTQGRRGASHRIEEKRGDVRVGTLRKEHGQDFLRDWRSDARLSKVREETDMSLTELVRQHRRGKK